ncbi:hypothetical protein [Nostoc sp. NMS4]|nr:hypothetical protein [Nostoc sp. NMS4]MBN3927368.1 hypothetical protein [Nostoc sp. NMS4]
MGRIKIRVTAPPKEMTKFLTAIHKAEESLRSLSLVQHGGNKPSIR